MTLDLETLVLEKGTHKSPKDGLCLMEAVALFAGKPHGDRPQCVSPVLLDFGITWNDQLDDERRQKLKRFIPMLVGTSGDAAKDQRRGWMAADWLIRVHTPAWLRLAKMEERAAALERLEEIDSPERLAASVPVLAAAQKDAAAAWDAAWDAARDAAWDAAWDAARDAAWDAAWDAARDAAWDAAWDAARDAAWAAAWDAARDAAWAAAWAAAWDAGYKSARAALNATEDALFESALKLYERMIAV